MKPGLAAMCLWAALAAPAEASDPVVVVQETRTPYFDKLLLVRRGAPVPSSLRPGDTATLSLPVPALEAARKTRYRFEYAGGPPHGGRPGPRRGGGVPAGRGRPTEPKPSSP